LIDYERLQGLLGAGNYDSNKEKLGMSAVGISKRLNIASSTASESVARGRQIVEEKRLKLLNEENE